VKQAGFAVLVYTKMPSVLVETGFITNPEEEKFLNSDAGSTKIATGIFNAFASYKSEVEGVKTSVITKPLNNLQDSIRISQNSVANYKKVQFYSSNAPLSVNDERLKDVKGFTIEQDKTGKYIYLSKKIFTKDEIEKTLEKLKSSGFKDSFIVTYSDNVRVE
jgi:N-acetylmuramoyl-L-alanine amidase